MNKSVANGRVHLTPGADRVSRGGIVFLLYIDRKRGCVV